jgi:hypothetical protein
MVDAGLEDIRLRLRAECRRSSGSPFIVRKFRRLLWPLTGSYYNLIVDWVHATINQERVEGTTSDDVIRATRAEVLAISRQTQQVREITEARLCSLEEKISQSISLLQGLEDRIASAENLAKRLEVARISPIADRSTCAESSGDQSSGESPEATVVQLRQKVD